MNPKLLGVWESRTSTDYTYTIRAADEYNYTIVKEKKQKSDEDKPTQYNAFISIVNGFQFLNLNEVYEEGNIWSHTEKKYYFYKITLQNDMMLALHEVTENITEQFNSSAELKTYFEKYGNLSFFY